MKTKPDNDFVTTREFYAGRERAPHLEQPEHRARLLATAELVRSVWQPGMTISDFGAGDGGLLSLLDGRRWGYDLMPSNIGHRGMDVRLVDFLREPVEYGDISIAGEVLEHLDDPAAFLRGVRSRWLTLSTPEDEEPLADGVHVWVWSAAEFEAMVESAGWRVRERRKVGRFQLVMASRPTMITLVPSRGRPQNIARMLDAYKATGASSSLVVLVDDDDPMVDAYLATGAHVVVGPRKRIGPTLNDFAPKCTHDVIGFMGDDHVPRTPGWDKAIWEASTHWSVVYGDDLYQRERLATACWQGRGIVQTIGQFCPPGCWHLYLDDYWMSLGRGLGSLRFLPNVVIEHVHPHAKVDGKPKAVKDDGYKECNSASMYQHDRDLWEEYSASGLAADLKKVKEAMLCG